VDLTGKLADFQRVLARHYYHSIAVRHDQIARKD
jgi:hypothetical protein